MIPHNNHIWFLKLNKNGTLTSGDGDRTQWGKTDLKVHCDSSVFLMVGGALDRLTFKIRNHSSSKTSAHLGATHVQIHDPSFYFIYYNYSKFLSYLFSVWATAVALKQSSLQWTWRVQEEGWEVKPKWLLLFHLHFSASSSWSVSAILFRCWSFSFRLRISFVVLGVFALVSVH